MSHNSVEVKRLVKKFLDGDFVLFEEKQIFNDIANLLQMKDKLKQLSDLLEDALMSETSVDKAYQNLLKLKEK